MPRDIDYLADKLNYLLRYVPDVLKAGALLTALGGFVLLLYFQRIRYLPPMNLAELTFLFSAAAIWAIQLLGLLGALTLTTGYFWHLAFTLPKVKENLVVEKWSAQITIVLLVFSLPTAAFVSTILLVAYDHSALAAAMGLTTLAGVWVFGIYRKLGLASSALLLLFLILSSILVFVAMFAWIGFLPESLRDANDFTAVLVVSLLVMGLLLMTALTIRPYDTFLVELSWTVRLAVWCIVIAPLSALILLVVVAGVDVTKIVAKVYGVGGIESADIVLDPEGKAAIEALGLRCALASNPHLCTLEDIGVLWARGTEYVIQIDVASQENVGGASDDEGQPSKLSVTLARERVLSLKVVLPKHSGL